MFIKYLILLACPLYCACIVINCHYDDQKCITSLAQQEFVDFVDGKPGKVESGDPLHLEEIVGDVPELKYTLRKFKLTGMRDCVPVLVHFTKASEADYHLNCPLLKMQAKYEMKGKLFHIDVDENGDVDIVLHNYDVVLHGRLNVTSVGSGNVIQIKDFDSEGVVQGPVTFDMRPESGSDAEQRATLSKFLQENGNEVAKYFGKPIVKAFMTKFIKNLNDYLGLIPDELKA